MGRKEGGGAITTLLPLLHETALGLLSCSDVGIGRGGAGGGITQSGLVAEEEEGGRRWKSGSRSQERGSLAAWLGKKEGREKEGKIHCRSNFWRRQKGRWNGWVHISCVFFSAVSPLQFYVEGTQKSNGAVVCSAANSTIMIVLPSELRTHSIPAIIVPLLCPPFLLLMGSSRLQKTACKREVKGKKRGRGTKNDLSSLAQAVTVTALGCVDDRTREYWMTRGMEVEPLVPYSSECTCVFWG